MTSRFLTRTLLLLLALCASLAAQGTDGRAPYTLNPDSVKANQAFDLQLLSYRFNCGTTYSHQSIKIEGKKVTLSFLPTEHPEALCPAVYMPYGPTFAMAPLAAGYYDVYARKLESCMVGPGPICAMEPVPEFAGVLSAGVTTRRGWFLQPAHVPPEQDFTLRLLNDAYGNCQTSFSREVIEFRNGAFHASFVIEQHPERVCVTDIRPHGPSFEMKGLPAGKYPVYANPQNPCRFDATTPCLAASSPDRFLFVDTLRVSTSTGVKAGGGDVPGLMRPEARGSSGRIRGYRADGRKPAPAAVQAAPK
jgi:hypothetical protein